MFELVKKSWFFFNKIFPSKKLRWYANFDENKTSDETSIRGYSKTLN